MTQEALTIMDTLEELFGKEILNKVTIRENEIIVELDNGSKTRITTKNVA